MMPLTGPVYCQRWNEHDGLLYRLKEGVCTCDAAAALKALRMTSVTRWLVSTLPPTTAASADGLKMVFGGIFTVTGFKHPCSTIHKACATGLIERINANTFNGSSKISCEFPSYRIGTDIAMSMTLHLCRPAYNLSYEAFDEQQHWGRRPQPDSGECPGPPCTAESR